MKVPPPVGPRWTDDAPPAPPPQDEPEDESIEVEAAIPGSLLLDIREPGEYAGGVAEGAMLLPMDMVPHHLERLPTDRPITVYCAAGVRSFGVSHWLREQGFAQAFSLVGGLSALRYDNHPVVIPEGNPGSQVFLAAGVENGVYHPAAEGEVIATEGGFLRVRVRDDHGFWVERKCALNANKA